MRSRVSRKRSAITWKGCDSAPAASKTKPDPAIVPALPPRVHPEAGRLTAAALQAAGERQCRFCEGPVTGRRRTFCSDPCAHEWRLRTSPSYVRTHVYRRDHGRCAVCGLNTASLRAKWNKLAPDDRAAAEKAYGLRRGQRTMWDADHIVPVALGGGQCGLEGYRTLCLPCHRTATAELRALLKAQKLDATLGSVDKQ